MQASSNILNEEFVVKQSKTAVVLIGFFFLGLFALVMYNFITHKTTNEYANNTLYKCILFTFVSGAGYLISSFKKKVIITVNAQGIYVMGELKTTWQNFINAKSTEEEVTGSISDHFILLIRYYKNDGIFETKIKMLNTYDKAGEEVIEAIKKFNQYRFVK